MEDAHTIISRESVSDGHDKKHFKEIFDKQHCHGFYLVCDGHDGVACSEFVVARLPEAVLTHPKFGSDLKMAIGDAINTIEREWFEHIAKIDNYSGGTTLVLAIFVRDKLCVANVGDSEAVLCRGANAIAMTAVHNTKKNKQELERVARAGGHIRKNRLAHPVYPRGVSLSVSRSIGDASFKSLEFTGGKKSGLICEPFIRIERLSMSDEFIILACDGLWDVINHTMAVSIARKVADTQRKAGKEVDWKFVARELCDYALMQGARDNITVLIIGISERTVEVKAKSRLGSNGRGRTRCNRTVSLPILPDASIYKPPSIAPSDRFVPTVSIREAPLPMAPSSMPLSLSSTLASVTREARPSLFGQRGGLMGSRPISPRVDQPEQDSIANRLNNSYSTRTDSLDTYATGTTADATDLTSSQLYKAYSTLSIYNSDNANDPDNNHNNHSHSSSHTSSESGTTALVAQTEEQGGDTCVGDVDITVERKVSSLDRLFAGLSDDEYDTYDELDGSCGDDDVFEPDFGDFGDFGAYDEDDDPYEDDQDD